MELHKKMELCSTITFQEVIVMSISKIKSQLRKAEREARRAEREAKRAEREMKRLMRKL